jgi:cobalt-zinc-cadmium efflux system protein
MAHDHSHHHHHTIGENDKPTNIVIAFWLNTLFALVEIIGGLYTNSVAILSDAVHDLGDSLSLGFAYYFHKKSKQKSDANYSYGYRRFSLLGAIINAVILTVSSIFIIYESVQRLWNPEQPDAGGMIVLAILGVLINGVAMIRLQKGKSINEQVVSLHFLEDVLGWVAVLIGSIVMWFTTVPILDPILSLLISGYILFNIYKNLKATLRILLQGKPENFDENELRKKIIAVPGVTDMHDLHFWTLDGQYHVVTMHVVVDPGKSLSEIEKIKSEVKHCLLHLDVQHTTIEVESEDERCAVKESGNPV